MFYEFAQGEENKINIITLQKQFVWSSTFENGKGFEKKNSFSKEGRKKEKKMQTWSLFYCLLHLNKNFTKWTLCVLRLGDKMTGLKNAKGKFAIKGGIEITGRSHGETDPHARKASFSHVIWICLWSAPQFMISSAVPNRTFTARRWVYVLLVNQKTTKW